MLALFRALLKIQAFFKPYNGAFSRTRTNPVNTAEQTTRTMALSCNGKDKKKLFCQILVLNLTDK